MKGERPQFGTHTKEGGSDKKGDNKIISPQIDKTNVPQSTGDIKHGQSNIRYVTTVEARNNISDVINCAGYGKETIALTRRGKVICAFVSIEDLQLLKSAKEALKTKEENPRKNDNQSSK